MFKSGKSSAPGIFWCDPVLKVQSLPPKCIYWLTLPSLIKALTCA